MRSWRLERSWLVAGAAALAFELGCSPPTASSCVYSISPTSVSLPPGGGSGAISVTTSSSCAWTAASNAGWLTITSGATGTGSGTVSVSAGANGQTPRSATLTIASQSVAVSQDGVPLPTFVLSGRVTDVFIGPAFGLVGVAVAVTGGPSAGSAMTDTSGNYAIPGLLAGAYTVTFTKAFYRAATAMIDVAGASVLPMTLSLDVPAVPSVSDLTGYWSGTGSYPNNPFKLVVIQDGGTFRGVYVDQHDASPSVSGSYAAPEFVLSVNFGDAGLLLQCVIEDAREINGVQRTPSLGNRPFAFTMKR